MTGLGVLLQRRNVHTHVIPRTLPRALAVRQAGPFAGVPDPLTLVSTPPFRRFFVLPAAAELPEQPGFLQLPFQQPQGQLHIGVLHGDGQHGPPSWISDRAGRAARAYTRRSAVMVYGSDPPADRVAMALAVRQRDGRAPRPVPVEAPACLPPPAAAAPAWTALTKPTTAGPALVPLPGFIDI